jgi:tetratricopeptide (TPR) repeat protein
LKLALALPLRSFRHQPFEAGTYETGNGQQYVVNGHMESQADEYTSIAEQLLHQDDASIAAMDAMMKIEVQHPEYILSNYCYDAALAGLLESAELACQQAIAENSHDIGQYDSLGFVHLRLKQWDKSIADYNKALYSVDDLTLSLYGRGVAKRAKGDIAGGDADIAAAQRDEPDIANIMRRLGVTGP